jgi:hypothetical protein
MTRQSKENPPVPDGGDPDLAGPPSYGNVETKVRADVGALTTTHPMGEALAEMAFKLARTLDEGAGLAVAAVNRELRANLIELARLGVEDDDDLDGALSAPSPGLPAEVRDTEES